MDDPQTLLNRLRQIGCYLEGGHYKLVSGKHSDSYIQVRIAMMDSETKQAFGLALAHQLGPSKPAVLAASTIGGILLAKETASRLQVPVLIGRRLAKVVRWVNAEELGQERLSRVVFVDDILTTGGTQSEGLESLRQIGAIVVGVSVAIDRSGGGECKLSFGDAVFEAVPLIRIALNQWDPSTCPICPKAYVNLHDPEEDFLSVVLSMPAHMAEKIFSGYREVYSLQGESDQVALIDQWKPWLPALLQGLPISRIGEDSGLVQFIRRFVTKEEVNPARKRVLTELVGHLLVLSNIRVESRSLGCSMIVGEGRKLLNYFTTTVPVEPPKGVKSSNLSELIPYYDALQETEAAFVFNSDGELIGIKRLARSLETGELRGIELLRHATLDCGAIGFLVRRARRALGVYREGRLEAIAELSERTGTWEFSTPRRIVEQINSLIAGISKTLELLLEVSREMVTRGYGGLFVVGEVPATLQKNPPTINVVKQPISTIGIGMLAEIAKLDGAVFVSKDGDLQEAAVIIVNTADETASSSGGVTLAPPRAGGARKKTASRTSKECPNAAIVCISQNGTVEIYVNGKTWPVSEAIAGVRR